MSKILVVNDYDGIQRGMERLLGLEKVESIQAYDVEDAARHLEVPSHGIDGILISGMKGRAPSFVKAARKNGFKGPIVAFSSDERVNKGIVRAGANLGISGIEPLLVIRLILKALEARAE